jgi:acyl carrier protein
VSCPGPKTAPETRAAPLARLAVSVQICIHEEGFGLATTLERIQGIVSERLGVDTDQIVESAEFIGDLNADSLDLVEVIMALEQEFDLEIKDEDAEGIRSVGDAVNYVEEHTQS